MRAGPVLVSVRGLGPWEPAWFGGGSKSGVGVS